MSPPLELFQAVSAHATPTKKDAENAKRRLTSLNVPIFCLAMCRSFWFAVKSWCHFEEEGTAGHDI